MLKKIMTLTSCLIAGLSVYADDHGPSMPTVYGQSYSMIVNNPAALLSAMENFRNSRPKDSAPSNVILLQNIANGENPTTHTINIFYQQASDLDNRTALNSRAGALFGMTMRESAQPHSENLFTMQRMGGNPSTEPTPGAIQMLIGLEVTDRSAFMSAFDKLWNSEATKAFPGGIFFGTAMGTGNDRITHWISFVAKDMATFTSGMAALQGSADMAKYLKNANSFRNYTSSSVGRQIQSWTDWSFN